MNVFHCTAHMYLKKPPPYCQACADSLSAIPNLVAENAALKAELAALKAHTAGSDEIAREAPGCIKCSAHMVAGSVSLKGEYRGVNVVVEMDGFTCPACGFQTIAGRKMAEFGMLLREAVIAKLQSPSPDAHAQALTRESVQAEAARLSAELPEIEMKYRRELWLGHGHEFAALYGDDGEMQCHACSPTWDYRRMPLADVEKAAHDARLLRVSKALEAQAIAQTQEK